MHRRSLFALAATAPLVAAGAAHAAGQGKELEVDLRVIEVQNLPIPVVRNHRLTNYLFATVRVELTDRGAQWSIRERAHFLRDGLLRASHRLDLAVADNDVALNRDAAVAAFVQAATEALGEGTVRGVQIAAESSLRRR